MKFEPDTRPERPIAFVDMTTGILALGMIAFIHLTGGPILSNWWPITRIILFIWVPLRLIDMALGGPVKRRYRYLETLRAWEEGRARWQEAVARGREVQKRQRP